MAMKTERAICRHVYGKYVWDCPCPQGVWGGVELQMVIILKLFSANNA